MDGLLSKSYYSRFEGEEGIMLPIEVIDVAVVNLMRVSTYIIFRKIFVTRITTSLKI
jgi:hypothetical protein